MTSARKHHPTLELTLDIVESDSSIGGGLLAGALAYRLFVLLLPSALLFVSGLGLYAGAVDKTPSTAAEEAGLHGLIAAQVASTASGSARWLSRSISRDFEMSQFWQNLHPRLQPAVPKLSTLVPGRK